MKAFDTDIGNCGINALNSQANTLLTDYTI